MIIYFDENNHNYIPGVISYEYKKKVPEVVVGNEEDWKTIVKSLYENFVKKGVPVYFGEYGAVRQDGYESFRLYYMEYITKLIHDYEMLPVYWDNGANGSGKDKFGLYNRSNYSSDWIIE